jgi:phosphoribosylformylglycinamidine cyclo-ligase
VSGSSYAASGVDIDAGDRAVELMKGQVRRAGRPEVVGGLGGFSGLFRLDTAKWQHPLLASSTDGVGTKLAIAQALDKHDTVGIDLVGMVVDDLVVCGAEPLFLQDYIACGQVVPAYDIAGTGVGVVEEDALLGPDRVRAGDVVIAMRSSGLHSNGFSLVRHVLLQGARMRLEAHVDELGGPLGECLLTPTRIYALDCLSLIAETEVHGFSHVTGGGLAANLARVLPPHLSATVDRGTWRPQPVFDLVQERGRVEPAEMERTFNLGVGMVALVAPADVDRALALLTARHVPSWVAGEVLAGDGSVTLTGSHAV